MRKKGVVVKFLSNMAQVQDYETAEIFLCKLRGKFKEQKIRPIVGDIVEYRVVHGKDGVIENIINRRNELKRPRIANVDQVIVVVTLKKPQTPLKIIDRYLVLVENAKLPLVIVLNKTDLLSDEEIEFFESIYSRIYKVLKTSALKGDGLDELKMVLKGKISTMAGMSGVGKSSLLNAISPGLSLKVNEISEKLERGKHTTTVIELLHLEFGGWIADTPGFASLDISGINPEDLKKLFPEFLAYDSQCMFGDCEHINEPNCAIKLAVEKGTITETRYQSYVEMFKELTEGK
ncbi:ribosome small subunit-dependent GTPase A [Thermosipho ferrireducens]|uniref:Small ribosomal subunit biogenesis GTPase RsgA n=1 Tax=Thermosipho ferrireducens TaxID=2571116 RepID=A0ABX7S626_9BACT|nr:ribosome small subunit-dependent GTPase A [Thermosipho ferrireducens]QTA38023.1 ribosome small subunit-dependent GTPase A [Thermosipho ferrireducens]